MQNREQKKGTGVTSVLPWGLARFYLLFFPCSWHVNVANLRDPKSMSGWDGWDMRRSAVGVRPYHDV